MHLPGTNKSHTHVFNAVPMSDSYIIDFILARATSTISLSELV